MHSTDRQGGLEGGEGRIRVLAVEPDSELRQLLARVLHRQGYQVETAACGTEALRVLQQAIYDVILLNTQLPGISGLDVLRVARARQTDAQILITRCGSVDLAVEAMKLGAYDHLHLGKPLAVDELLRVIDRGLRERELHREAARLRGQARTPGGPVLVGSSPAMQRLRELIERAAPARLPVLVTGESGSGKELVARSIHERSSRAGGPFVAIHCAALPADLVEMELFGYARGSIPGATGSKPGLIEEADRGTLFLDEIGMMEPASRIKLLRVLQERAVRRIGAARPVPVDFRLITSCSVDLREQVRAGAFNEHLYYRLAGFPIHVPPLREHPEDIPLLASYFRHRIAREYGMEPPEFSTEALRCMREYPWPGNVRELEHFVEQALLLHAGSATVPFEPPACPQEEEQGARALLHRARDEQWTLERLEREHTLGVLEDMGGHQGRASEVLGIDRRTLHRRLQSYRNG